MTIGLQLTDGTTIVDLNDGSYNEVMELDLGYGDVSAETVVGSIRVFINSSTLANVQAELAAIQKMLQAAVDTSGLALGGALYSGLDQIVYLNYKSTASETYYRSQIVRAGIRIEPGSLEIINFACGGIEIAIDFERKNWWEGAETLLQCSTHLASATTNAQTVYNPTFTYEAATIAFVNATGKITDSANGLANFKTGDTITITGSASNDGSYLIATGGVAGEIVVDVGTPVADEGAGATVYIHGADCNWVEIAAAQIGGDMPAPTKIYMVNTWDSSVDGVASRVLKYVWIGQNFTGTPSAFEHLYEGEAGSTGADTEDSISSGGYYTVTSIPTGSGGGVETTVDTWRITDATANARNGRYVKLFVGFKIDDTAFENMRFRLILIRNFTTFWQSNQVTIDTSTHTNIRDLFTFALPPTVAGLGNLSGFYFRLTAYHEQGTSQDCKIDWIQLIPVDGYTFVKTRGVANADEITRIVLDGFKNVAYTDVPSTSNTISPQAVTAGVPIMLQPGRINRLYFLQHSDYDYEYYARQSMTIQVYYRPRRMSI